MSSARYEVADSEDEDETFLINSQVKTSGTSSNQRKAKSGINHAISTLTTDVGIDTSTASTAQLLNSAFRNLAETMTDSPASTSTKRRSTTIDESHKTPCVQRKAKRVKTYSDNHTTRSIDENDMLQALRDESSPQRDLHDAAGRFDEMFRDHEPQVLFRDSGSTAPDNESSLPHTHEGVTAEEQAGGSAETPARKDSSSFPWPLSRSPDQTAPEQDPADNHDETQDQLLAVPTVTDIADNDVAFSKPANVDNPRSDANAFTSGIFDEEDQTRPAAGKPSSSPYVEITSRKCKSATPDQEDCVEQRAIRSKKRKISARDVEQSPSDDLNGLPKERYVPRPSLRRATQISDANIDYSAIPEKAAKKKAKRCKTAGDVTQAEKVEQLSKDTLVSRVSASAAQDEVSGVSKECEALPSNENADAAEAARDGIQEADARPASHKDSTKPRKTAKSCPQSDFTPATESGVVDIISPPKRSTQERRNDEDGFAIPLSISKPSAKARRSHTTIFEDHTEFKGSQKSPSLKQQQAERKTQVLKQLTGQRGRKSKKKVISVADCEDEEDELSRVSEDEDTEPTEAAEEVPVQEPLKKRGRGRPKKAAAQAVAPAPVEDPEAADEQIDDTNVPARDATPMPESQKEKETAPDAEQGEPPRSTPSDKANAQKSKDTPASRQVELAQSTPEVTHSPIKSLAGVKYRVGLSKRQRIPSLLRTRKPVKVRNTA